MPNTIHTQASPACDALVRNLGPEESVSKPARPPPLPCIALSLVQRSRAVPLHMLSRLSIRQLLVLASQYPWNA
ncbi:hypothetical protein PENSPDRAFT_2789 [Peniophora sp. CONT]|nr:hypothetical protein PENSPDRAFT_2789 [Peniophora sp. CONT]